MVTNDLCVEAQNRQKNIVYIGMVGIMHVLN